MVDRLSGLRHDAVVGGYDDDDHIGDLGAAGAHRREGGVARGVKEGDRLLVVVDLVGADVLGDAASLAGGDLGLADRVEQRGLAVVDVTHDRHHRWPVDQVLVGVGELRLLGLLVGGVDDLDLAVVLVGDRLHRVVGEGLGERRHLAHHHQFFDHLGRGEAERFGYLAHGRAGIDLARLGLVGRVRLRRRLLEQGPATAPTTATRRALGRRSASLLATRSLGVDHHTAFFRGSAAASAAALLGTASSNGFGRSLWFRGRRFRGGFRRRRRVLLGLGSGLLGFVTRFRGCFLRRPGAAVAFGGGNRLQRIRLLDAGGGGFRLHPGRFQRGEQLLRADALRFRDLMNPFLCH